MFWDCIVALVENKHAAAVTCVLIMVVLLYNRKKFKLCLGQINSLQFTIYPFDSRLRASDHEESVGSQFSI